MIQRVEAGKSSEGFCAQVALFVKKFPFVQKLDKALP